MRGLTLRDERLVSNRTYFMALQLNHGQPVILIRQHAYERSGIVRQALDERYNLTADEFAVESGIVRIGPLPSDELLADLISELEQNGLTYFDDFFEMSGNWPDWLALYVRGEKH